MMKSKDVTKEFPFVDRGHCWKRREELDAKSCSQLLTAETVKVMLIIHC